MPAKLYLIVGTIGWLAVIATAAAYIYDCYKTRRDL